MSAPRPRREEACPLALLLCPAPGSPALGPLPCAVPPGGSGAAEPGPGPGASSSGFLPLRSLTEARLEPAEGSRPLRRNVVLFRRSGRRPDRAPSLGWSTPPPPPFLVLPGEGGRPAWSSGVSVLACL